MKNSSKIMPIINKENGMTGLTSQLVTYKQMTEPVYEKWLEEMKEENYHNRKQWEYVFILQALKEHGMLREGKRGLGFGVGSEPIAAVLAKYGVEIVATEINIEKKNDRGWIKGRDVASELQTLNRWGICDTEKFHHLVSFKDVDMNYIPEDLWDFDFNWSSCALEHLGNMDLCTEFIFKSLETLKPGGVAVHTTEFTLAKKLTVKEGFTIFFRESDIREIERRLTAEGHKITVNFHKGNTIHDWMIDIPPYKKENHIKLLISKHWKLLVATSLGLIIQKKS
jgi:hypothetical protein